jgi:Family of unknown function (DUF6152)
MRTISISFARASLAGALTFALGSMAQMSTAKAHHSQALFDLAKCASLQGTVRTWQYQYPHSWLWLFVDDGKGKQDVWGFEAAAPANMIEKDTRWSRNVLKKGDKVTIRYSPTRNGQRAGALASVTLPDGYRIEVPAPACGGGPPPDNRASSKTATK